MGEQKQAGSLVKVLTMQAWWCHGRTSFPKIAFLILYVYCDTHHTHALIIKEIEQGLGRQICNSSILCEEMGSQDNSQNPKDPLSNVPSNEQKSLSQSFYLLARINIQGYLLTTSCTHSTSLATLKRYKHNVCTALVDGMEEGTVFRQVGQL